MTALDTENRPVATAPPSTSLGDSVMAYFRRVGGGDLGALPAILGLIILCAVFTILRPVFLTAYNFANLFTQGAAVTIIAMGLVFVLLLGEIDLSAGFTSGVCAAVLAVCLENLHWPWYAASAAALLTGLMIGSMLGFLVAKFGIPSFVVTLAAFLAFQGVALIVLGQGKNITIHDDVINAIENKNLPVWLGWALFGVTLAGFALLQLRRRVSRASQGLSSDPLSLVLLKIIILGCLGAGALYALSLERSPNPPHIGLNGKIQGVSLTGVPIVVPLIALLLMVGTFVLRRTRYGRHIYAVGGSAEAARRAGIAVQRIRISAFMICSSVAAVGGIVAASRLTSVDPNTGGSTVLLYAVGAAVIGGTSLFGGKGRVLDAVLGGAVIAVIDNGMSLLNLAPGIKYIVTGLVLLLAAGVDALARRRAAAGV
jgi:D-xylose transport system permease protein